MTPETQAQILAGLNARLGGHNRELGLRFVSVSDDHVAADIPITEQHHQPYGLVHGGVYAALVETLCSVGAALYAQQRGQSVVGLENCTSFLRAAREGTLHGRAVPLIRGRRSQVWETTITDDQGKLLATGKVRLLCLDPGAEVAGEVVAAKGGD